MATEVHSLAAVDPRARLGTDVQVGPFAVVGPEVELGDGCEIHSHAVVTGHTRLGRRCQVFPGAVVGGPPQDLKYKGGMTRVEVGDENVIRECVTVNRGTELGGGVTRIGNNNLLMAYVHIAHDCRLDNRIVISNAAQMAGHVWVEEGARIGGLAAIHQFVRIGRCSFVAGCARLSTDVPPYTLVQGHPARVRGLNLEGLKRRSVPEEAIVALKKAFRMVFHGDGTRVNAYKAVQAEQLDRVPVVQELMEFLRFMDQGRHGRGQEAEREDIPPQERDGAISFTVNGIK